MNVWFCSPAWRRYNVSRLAFAQRRNLCDRLAARGLQANCVIVADDDNLDIAHEYGFHTIEQDNSELGRRFNTAIKWACTEGEADYIVHIGSDDWVHEDVFDVLPGECSEDPPPIPEGQRCVVWRPGPQITAGRRIGIVDLERGVLQRCYCGGPFGVVPLVIPRAALEPSGFEPIKPEAQRGIDGSLIRGLGVLPNFVFHDPHDLACVDFKTPVNITAYAPLKHVLGQGRDEEDAYEALAERYPQHLVDLARATAKSVRAAA